MDCGRSSPIARVENAVIRPIRLITLAPGHFHAALVQKHMALGVHPRAYVYAPLDDDLAAHLAKLAGFNSRESVPTAWELDVRTGPNYLERCLREQPGNTLVIAGRNRPKIDLILAGVTNGLFVLADKPWVIRAADFPKLERVFAEADLRDVFAKDMMTERFEITSRLQYELVRDPDVFGKWTTGAADRPALTLESVHYLKKTVAGSPLRRPPWWFDVDVAGEAIADVGTHLADLALWLFNSEPAIDYRRDVKVLDATCWPTRLSREQFTSLTGLNEIPAELLAKSGDGPDLLYRGNGTTNLQIRGIHTRLTTRWDYEAPLGQIDSHESVAVGTKSRVIIRPTPNAQGAKASELFVSAVEPGNHAWIVKAVRHWCDDWQEQYPGLLAVDRGDTVHIQVPDELRTVHEDHFAAVFAEYREDFANRRHIPAVERTQLLAKYFITTRAVELAYGRGMA